MKVVFINKWYPILLFLALGLVVIVQIINLLSGIKPIPTLFLFLSLFTLISLFCLNEQIAETLVKVCSCLAILGGGLGLFSIVLFLLIGRLEENVNLSESLRDILHFGIGLILFKYWDKSVIDR